MHKQQNKKCHIPNITYVNIIVSIFYFVKESIILVINLFYYLTKNNKKKNSFVEINDIESTKSVFHEFDKETKKIPNIIINIHNTININYLKKEKSFVQTKYNDFIKNYMYYNNFKNFFSNNLSIKINNSDHKKFINQEDNDWGWFVDIEDQTTSILQ